MDQFKTLSQHKILDSTQVKNLIVNLGFNREFYTALSCFYHAESSIQSDQYGVSLAYYNKAKLLLTSQVGYNYTADAPCVPKINTKAFEPVRAGLDNLVSRIDASYAKVDRDNNIIHFQMQPKGDLIADLPAGIIVTPLKTYAQPNPVSATNPIITFVKIEVKSIFSKVKDSFSFSNDPSLIVSANKNIVIEENKGKSDVNPTTSTSPPFSNPDYTISSTIQQPMPNNIPYTYNPNPSANAGYAYDSNNKVPPNPHYNNQNITRLNPQENFGNKSDFEIAQEIQRRFDAEDLGKK
jgi:hypothetical protein